MSVKNLSLVGMLLVPSFAFAFNPPPPEWQPSPCEGWDQSCVVQDLGMNGCRATFRKMALIPGGAIRWYVTSSRGGGALPIEESSWKNSIWMIDYLSSYMDANEVNSCPARSFMACMYVGKQGSSLFVNRMLVRISRQKATCAAKAVELWKSSLAQ